MNHLYLTSKNKMKKIIILLLLLLTMFACKSSKHAKCDAYSSVSKTSQK